MSVTVSARLLGAPQLLIEGQPPPSELLWRKNLALCIVLWGAPERTRSRDQLIGMLWGDKGDKAAKHSLNEALRVIRQAAGADAIATNGDFVSWVGMVDLDTDQFAEAERNAPESAAAFATGAYCDGFAVPGAHEFESWLDSERERWLSRTVAVLAKATATAESRGDTALARDLASRATALNPRSDLATQALIRAHWLDGDRGAALAAGEEHRRRLADELGVKPDAHTEALLQRVGRAASPQRPVGAANEVRRAPLIGREESLGQLIAAWRNGNSTVSPRLLTITGATGSGRSRLLEELVARAVLAGATVASLHAVEADGNDQHAAVVGLARAGLGAAPGIAGAPAAALAAFMQRVPDWNERFHGVDPTTVLEIRQAFVAIVHAVASERALVLVIDDVDRLNPDEVRWLAAMLRSANGLDLTLVVTATSGGTAGAADDLIRSAGRDIPGITMRLDPLTLDQLRALVDWAAPSWEESARDRLARRLIVESAGLPALAIDVLHALQQGGSLGEMVQWPAPDQTLDTTLPGPLPESQAAILRVAFRRLGPDAQKLLVAASLLEEPFSAEEAGVVAELIEASARDAALDALEWDGWIAMDARGYSFPARAKRRLVRSELMTPGLRRRLEARIRPTEVLRAD